ncbi:MAG: hypothetical protein RL094_452 [Candidatus Parcubacteria bacterium]|jgi:hypothetical protein
MQTARLTTESFARYIRGQVHFSSPELGLSFECRAVVSSVNLDDSGILTIQFEVAASRPTDRKDEQPWARISRMSFVTSITGYNVSEDVERSLTLQSDSRNTHMIFRMPEHDDDLDFNTIH